MFDINIQPDVLGELQRRHLDIFEKVRLPYYLGCRLRILIVADNFLYFNDENFGLSELVRTLRGLSTWRYPVQVDLAHRANPGAARLNGATPNFSFTDDSLRPYHQVWIMAAERSSAPALADDQRQAIRRFMDGGGGVFATGDHEDLGATVGGYIPRIRSMRKWFWPVTGPQGEPVAPHGTDATRHDTNRPGYDGVFHFNDQSDDVPQTITPHYFGGGLIRSTHPVLCTPQGPIRVLPDHPHEGECLVPGNLGGNYSIGNDSFREYPDGPGGTPLAPVVIATATMLAGAAVPEFGKPPIPGGSFGVMGAWDGHKAGAFGRIVVDATWHHFININLIGDRGLGAPNAGEPKTLGFLATTSGQAHLARIKAYYTNIADWLTPKARRRCLIFRHIWCIVQEGAFLEHVRADDLAFTGALVVERLRWLGPCDRWSLIVDLGVALRPEIHGLLDPFGDTKLWERLKLDGMSEVEMGAWIDEVVATHLGAVALSFSQLNLSPDQLKPTTGEDEAEVKALSEAAAKGIAMAQETLARRGKERSAACKALATLL
jgi:hypothetical protein